MRMRTGTPATTTSPRAGTQRPQLRNRLPEHLAASRLSAEQVAQRVEAITGTALDRRTLRRYLSGAPVLDATAVTLAAIAQALEIPLGNAVELEVEDALEAQLSASGRRLLSAAPGPVPRLWGRPDPAWGDLVEPFLEDRRSRY